MRAPCALLLTSRYGVRYAYLDPAFAEPPSSHNLIDRSSVLVDTAELTRAARLLLEGGTSGGVQRPERPPP